MAQHPIVHIELSSHDLEKTAKFYSDLFGWQTEYMPQVNYATFETGAGPGGGFNPITDENPKGAVIIYVDTDDIEADLKKVEDLGGKVILPKTIIPQTGWFAIFEDISGNRVGLYTKLSA